MLCLPVALIQSFSNDDGNGKENVTLNKHRLNRDYFRLFVLFVFYIVSKWVRYKWIGVRDVKLNKEN